MKDPIERLRRRIEKLEKEMDIIMIQLEKVLKLYKSITEYYKYISTNIEKWGNIMRTFLMVVSLWLSFFVGFMVCGILTIGDK